jgi:hypothetical protein
VASEFLVRLGVPIGPKMHLLVARASRNGKLYRPTSTVAIVLVDYWMNIFAPYQCLVDLSK